MPLLLINLLSLSSATEPTFWWRFLFGLIVTLAVLGIVMAVAGCCRLIVDACAPPPRDDDEGLGTPSTRVMGNKAVGVFILPRGE